MLLTGVAAGMASPPSMGWPRTLNIRPSTASPTGTWMVWPGADTSMPRARPSLAASMTQRTVWGSRCWDTSITRPAPPTWTVRASRMRGRGKVSKATSTTGPET